LFVEVYLCHVTEFLVLDTIDALQGL